MSDEPLFDSALQVEATAYAIHPEGAEVPGDDPAEQSAQNEEK